MRKSEAYIQYNLNGSQERNPFRKALHYVDRLSVRFKVDMRYIVSGAFWGNANYFIVSLLAFITSILFARLLTKEQFGTYQYILSIAGLLSSITLTGMNASVTRAIAKGFEGELKRSVRYQIILGIIPTFIALVVSGWYLFHSQASISISLLWIALFLPAANAFNTWATYTGGKKLFRIGTYYGFANNIISYAGVIIMLCITRNFIWVAFGNFFFGFLGNFIMYKLTIRRFKPNDSIEKDTLSYGTHLSVMNIPNAASSQLDALLVFHFVGPAALAIYTFATLIPEKLAGGLKLLSSIALPKFSEKPEESVKRFLIKNMPLMLIGIGTVIGIYALIAPWIFNFFFPAYDASIPFTQVYALSFFSIIGGIVQAALQSQKKTKALYITSFLTPSIEAFLLVVLMYYFGVWGILWAQIITNIIQIPIQMSFLEGKSQTN